METIQSLQQLVKNFCEERDWNQFHTPKDLSIGIATEASEIMELFRFKSDAEVQQLVQTPVFKEKLGDEVADVFFFVLRLCQMNNIDLEKSFKHKMAKNAEKYSVEKAKGSNKKYTEF
ncbi:nucleotide pyrophosphohydrolase [bacterium]|nr:nucleotide pyrophosphohydrolase [bacterium]